MHLGLDEANEGRCGTRYTRANDGASGLYLSRYRRAARLYGSARRKFDFGPRLEKGQAHSSGADHSRYELVAMETLDGGFWSIQLQLLSVAQQLSAPEPEPDRIE